MDDRTSKLIEALIARSGSNTMDAIIQGAELLAAVRDQGLYKGAYPSFEAFCQGVLGWSMEQVESITSLVDNPQFLWIREASRVLMDEFGLGFEAAVSEVGSAQTEAAWYARLQGLRVIRDAKLYQKSHASFEAYVRECYCNGDEPYTQQVLDVLQGFPLPGMAGQRVRA